MKTTTKGHLAVLGTNVFFSINYSLIKLISPSMLGPYAVNLMRVGISIVLFWTMWLFGETPAGISKKDIGRFVLCAITGIAINQMLFVKGLTLTSTIHASLLTLATPILVTFFALWLLKERMGMTKAAGLALGLGGSIFLILQKEGSHNASDYLLGDMLILCNAISYSIYFILVKPLMKNYSPLHVIRWVFTLGLFMILPFCWKQTAAINWSNWQWYHYVALFMVTVPGTFLAYYFNAYGIKTIGPGTTGTYIYTQPLFVVIIATVFLHEVLTIEKMLAGLCIIAGVFLVGYRSRTAKQTYSGNET